MAKSQSTKINEIGRRKSIDRRKQPIPVVSERRKVQRRRQIDPTTCEREYSDDEVEFMHSLDQYKRENGRMFPTCSEILEVLLKIGYVKMPARPGTDTTPISELSPSENTDA